MSYVPKSVLKVRALIPGYSDESATLSSPAVQNLDKDGKIDHEYPYKIGVMFWGEKKTEQASVRVADIGDIVKISAEEINAKRKSREFIDIKFANGVEVTPFSIDGGPSGISYRADYVALSESET